MTDTGNKLVVEEIVRAQLLAGFRPGTVVNSDDLIELGQNVCQASRAQIIEWLRAEANKMDLMAKHLQERLDNPPNPPFPAHLTPRPEAPAEVREGARYYRLIADRLADGADERKS